MRDILIQVNTDTKHCLQASVFYFLAWPHWEAIEFLRVWVYYIDTLVNINGQLQRPTYNHIREKPQGTSVKIDWTALASKPVCEGFHRLC